MNQRHVRWFLAGTGVLLAIVLIALLARRALLPSLTEEQVRDQVITTLQREAQASFLVTGTLDIVATTTVENTREILPELLDITLGTSTATVQVPGRAFYGFDVRQLKPEQIRISGDTLVEITVPAPEVYSVEPNLSELRVWTERGWARSASSTRRAERRALALVNGALMRQAKIHLQNSVQPHMNTAEALQRMLTPALRSAGLPADAVYRFTIGTRVIQESQRLRPND